MGYDIDALKKNPNAKVSIVLYSNEPGGKEIVSGVVVDPKFSSDGSTEWSSPFEALLGGAQDKFGNVLNAGTTVVNRVVGTDMSQMQLKTVEDTLATFAGHKKPIFNINMLFLATEADHDVRTPVLKLLQAVYPNSSTPIKAPFGYTGKEIGTVTLKIGRWIIIPFLLISSISYSFSTTVIKSGSPLYSEANIIFQPYKLPTYEQVKGWYPGVKI